LPFRSRVPAERQAEEVAQAFAIANQPPAAVYSRCTKILRARGKRPRGRRAAEQRDEIASGSTTLIVQPSPFTYRQRGRIIASAMKNGLGTIFGFPVAAQEGSLIAYGPDYLHMYRRAPLYVDRILKGTNPADLPVEQPAKVEFLINLQTAKTLGIEVPLSLLIRADELLE